jgi:hypothetical protein
MGLCASRRWIGSSARPLTKIALHPAAVATSPDKTIRSEISQAMARARIKKGRFSAPMLLVADHGDAQSLARLGTIERFTDRPDEH